MMLYGFLKFMINEHLKKIFKPVMVEQFTNTLMIVIFYADLTCIKVYFQKTRQIVYVR